MAALVALLMHYDKGRGQPYFGNERLPIHMTGRVRKAKESDISVIAKLAGELAIRADETGPTKNGFLLAYGPQLIDRANAVESSLKSYAHLLAETVNRLLEERR